VVGKGAAKAASNPKKNVAANPSERSARVVPRSSRRRPTPVLLHRAEALQCAIQAEYYIGIDTFQVPFIRPTIIKASNSKTGKPRSRQHATLSSILNIQRLPCTGHALSLPSPLAPRPDSQRRFSDLRDPNRIGHTVERNGNARSMPDMARRRRALSGAGPTVGVRSPFLLVGGCAWHIRSADFAGRRCRPSLSRVEDHARPTDCVVVADRDSSLSDRSKGPAHPISRYLSVPAKGITSE
jgi:hypothetical protein